MQQTRPSVATEGCGAPVGRGVRLLDAGVVSILAAEDATRMDTRRVEDDGEKQRQEKKQIPCGNDNKKSKNKSNRKGKSKSKSKGKSKSKSKSKSNGKRRSRFPAGMTNRRAKTRAKTRAKARARARTTVKV